jgi:hypothetical protein
MIGLIDYCNSTAIYISNITPALRIVFQESLRFIFLPIYAAASLLYTGFALAQLLIDRDEKNHIKKRHALSLTINFISSCLIVTAVVGGLAFAATFGIAFPFLLGANLCLTGTYNFASAAYYFYQAHQKEKLAKQLTASPKEHERLINEAKKDRDLAKMRCIVGITVVLFMTAGALIVFTGILPFAAIGILGTTIGIIACLYGLHKTWQNAQNNDNINPAYPFNQTAVKLAGEKHNKVSANYNLSTTAATLNATGTSNPDILRRTTGQQPVTSPSKSKETPSNEIHGSNAPANISNAPPPGYHANPAAPTF